jgi:hypothetical protein
MFKGTLWEKNPKKSPHFEKTKLLKSPIYFFVGFGQIIFF